MAKEWAATSCMRGLTEGVAARTPSPLSESAADGSRTRRSLSLLSGPRLGHGELALFFAIHEEPGLRAVAELHRAAVVLALTSTSPFSSVYIPLP